MKVIIEEHRKGLIELYFNQLQFKNDTTFMKCVLREAIRRLKIEDINPKRVEDWVVEQDKKQLTF